MANLPYSPFSPNQQRFLAYVPKPAASMSILCSIFLIQRIIRDPKRLKLVYHRIILVLNIHTCILCVAIFLGTWPVAKDSSSTVHGAIGTERTCNVQGFIILFEIGTIASFYLTLSLFSFLAIRNDFKERILRKYEPWLHTSIYLIPLVFGCIALKKKFISPGTSFCFLSPYPTGSNHDEDISYIHGNSEIQNFSLIVLVYFYVIVIFAVALTTSVFFFVRRKEKENEGLDGLQKYRENARKSKSRKMASQTGLYLGTFICTHSIPILAQSGIMIHGRFNFQVYMLAPIMISIQGVVNMFIYQRLLVRKHPTGDPCMRPKMDSLEKRVSLASVSFKSEKEAEKQRPRSSCPGNMLSLKDQSEFSIFDGTNASEVWNEFINEFSDPNEDIEIEEGNQIESSGELISKKHTCTNT